MGPDEWGLAAGIVGAVAAVVSTGFEVRGRLAHRRAPAPSAPPAVDPGGSFDVFISYAEADGGSAETLASRLRAEGLRVFLGRWIGPGLVESLEKEAALHASANGLLAFSVATTNDPAIRDEYAALLQRVHSGGRRFIPVLVEDVDLPPFARIRRPVDLRDRPGKRPIRRGPRHAGPSLTAAR